MTLKQNITSILECYFTGFKDEIIDACANRIVEQIERQNDAPQTVVRKLEEFKADVPIVQDTAQTDCPWK